MLKWVHFSLARCADPCFRNPFPVSIPQLITSPSIGQSRAFGKSCMDEPHPRPDVEDGVASICRWYRTPWPDVAPFGQMLKWVHFFF